MGVEKSLKNIEKERKKVRLSPSLKEENEMQITQNLSLSSLIVNVASAKIALIGLTNGYTTMVTALVGPTSSGNEHICLFIHSLTYSFHIRHHDTSGKQTN